MKSRTIDFIQFGVAKEEKKRKKKVIRTFCFLSCNTYDTPPHTHTHICFVLFSFAFVFFFFFCYIPSNRLIFPSSRFPRFSPISTCVTFRRYTPKGIERRRDLINFRKLTSLSRILSSLRYITLRILNYLSRRITLTFAFIRNFIWRIIQHWREFFYGSWSLISFYLRLYLYLLSLSL